MSERILIVNVNWVGDVLFSTPFIRAVRRARPGAHIACLIHPRCSEMLGANPRVDETIVYDEEGVHRSVAGKLRLVLELRRKRFDTAFILHRSFTKALIAYLAGIRRRAGYATKGRAGLLTDVVEDPDGPCHKVDYFLNIARASKIEPDGDSCEFFVAETDRQAVGRLLAGEGIKSGDRVVVLCPGGNWDPKRWPKESFARLGGRLAARPGTKVVISGAAKDSALAAGIARMMPGATRPAVTAGRTTLGQLGALLERAALVVANDSGPMHMAVALKAPTIALFGPTSPGLTGPRGSGVYAVISGDARRDGLECEVPCYDVTCAANECMSGISVDAVYEKADGMLG
jgi:heptosyltransferase-2